ncbi:hypothetical protein ACFZCP_03975 [Streptomyces sp. NPDC007971]|uniref:hypothetical protein n=1 Tax=Streptomyces sp. NPDC007971 TaxID=3364799 RepID=UPI0036E59BAB
MTQHQRTTPAPGTPEPRATEPRPLESQAPEARAPEAGPAVVEPEQDPVTVVPDPTPVTVEPEPAPITGEPEPTPFPLESAAGRKDRRRLRSVLRWAAAVVVFAVAGGATAYGVTQMKRDDLPGLATRSDGRWDYPQIVHPPLPAGSPAPFADTNRATAHYADLRRLVLPAPRGGTADKALAGDHGWVEPKVFLAEYASKEDRDTLAGEFTDRGLRHIAARGWTMPDGTRTRIYLLQFDTGLVAGTVQQDHFSGYDQPAHALRGAPRSTMDEQFPERAQVPNVLHYAYDESRPYGAEQVRQAYVLSGDVLGLVVQSRKGGAKAVPFQQTVVLQEQLLG